MKKDRVLIMGAAGRDFHNFNVYFRGNEAYEVMTFTATQIPNIEGRVYPSELAGPDYPDGIPIYPESKLTELIKELGETINNIPCDLVIVATPIDLRRLVEISHPAQRVRYELQEIGQPTLKDVLSAKFG